MRPLRAQAVRQCPPLPAHRHQRGASPGGGRGQEHPPAWGGGGGPHGHRERCSWRGNRAPWGGWGRMGTVGAAPGGARSTLCSGVGAGPQGCLATAPGGGKGHRPSVRWAGQPQRAAGTRGRRAPRPLRLEAGRDGGGMATYGHGGRKGRAQRPRPVGCAAVLVKYTPRPCRLALLVPGTEIRFAACMRLTTG